jgi:hypothetical protein
MTICMRSRSRLMLLALVGLVAVPQGVFAQTSPDTPDLVQALSQQSFEESLTSAQASAPLAAAGESQSSGMRTARAAATSGFRCLPSCSQVDGRFMAVAGANLVTLSGREMVLQISVPAGSSSFTLGVFDGDVRGTDGAGLAHWDIGVLSNYDYTLYADPLGNGTGATVVQMQPGFPSVSSSAMPDNAWIDFTVPTGPAALSPSGNYFYRLSINLTNPSLTTLNAFKIRATAVVSGLTLDPEEEPFSYIASFTSVADAQTIYPNYPASPVPSNYDGNFDFYFDLPVSKADVEIWDGDFDRGKYNGTESDTDDPNTPGFPFVPSWATIDTRPEGVAVGVFPSTGNPPDDRNPAPPTTGPFILKTPSVRYDLSFPNSQLFPNENPSGNQEWERFKITTDTSDPFVDYNATSIPAGTYHLRVAGVDMQNLNALLLPGRLLCVEENGTPCQPLRPFLVGDTVFFDRDGNGAQGTGEPGLSGIVLELVDSLGAILATTTTDAAGKYSFPVEALTYTVRIAGSNFNPGGLLNGFIATTPAQLTETVVNHNVLTYDFGYRGNGSLGDRLWLDRNGNSAQDAGETGLNGVTVELLDADGHIVATTTTGGDGGYTFDHLAPGSFTVRVNASTLPPGLAATYDLDGITTADQAAVTLAAGAHRTDVDFGYRGTASIGDRIWYDINANVLQGANEMGLNGVTVELLDADGNSIATTVTSGDGNYSFTGLLGGTYTVRVAGTTLPGDDEPTFDADGIATPDTAVVALTSGQTRTDVDFGYRGTGALGDRVWFDINSNGAQDADEVGINGVTVQLLDGSGNVLASAMTSGNGGYTFAGLLPGTYGVRVLTSTLPGGAVATYDLDGTATPSFTTATVANSQNLNTVDFGYRGTASLGDRVWLDLSGNGVQDTGEPGLSGVAVELVDAAGNVLASNATSSAGIYGFTSLLAGAYTVRVVSGTLPGGLVQTYDADGTGTANSAAVSLATGQSRTDVDFGYRGTLQFGDRVWFDYDGNKIQDTGEPGLNGVTIELRDSSGTLIATATTSGNGNYTFANLPAGSYTVTVVAATLPGGALPTYDIDGTATANTAVVSLATGQSRTDVDFGYRGTASVGDRVWLDYDADGVQDAGEVGINGAGVQLLDANNTVIATASTAGNGNYTFPNLLAGTYKVRVVTSTLPAGAVQTYDLDGTGTASLATAAVTGGQSRTDVDFGYRVTAPGTATIGYWKTHPEAWPVATVTVGGVVYTRDQAIALIGTPSRGDKSIDLFKQLAAAKLNLIAGNNPSCIYSTIASADSWMATYPPGSNVGGSSPAWTTASPWHTTLDNYNNGQLCAPHRN